MKRRALIMTVGVVATLPSGVTQAMGSAAQRTMNEASNTERLPAVDAITPDEYLRLRCTARRWTDANTREVVVAFQIPESTTSDKWYTGDGLEFDPQGWRPVKWDTGEFEQEALCLAVYEADEQWATVTYLGAWPQQQIGGQNTPLTQSCMASFAR